MSTAPRENLEGLEGAQEPARFVAKAHRSRLALTGLRFSSGSMHLVALVTRGISRRSNLRKKRMAANLRLAVAMAVLVALVLSAAGSRSVKAGDPVVNPEATRILKRMTDFTSKLQKFSVHTESTSSIGSTPAKESTTTLPRA